MKEACDPLQMSIGELERLTRRFTQTLTLSRKRKISMRTAALSLGINRMREAKKLRGLFP